MNKNQLNEKTFDQYLSARNDFAQGKYKLASKKLLPINMVTDNNDVNHLLLLSLYYQKDYQAAERILFQDINFYTSNTKLTYLMIKVLLKNNEFISCYEIISPFQNKTLKKNLLKMIKYREKLVIVRESKRLSTIEKRFYHLSGVSLIRQRIILKEAQQLPLKRFIMIAKGLLIDPFLAPIMRLSILDIFRKIGFYGKLKFRWIDKRVYLININKLVDLTDTVSYQKVMKIIESKYFHNPSRMVILKQILRLDLSYLYPFNDQKIKDPSSWVQIAALRLQGKQPLFINSYIKSIYFLQVKLERLTKALVKYR